MRTIDEALVAVRAAAARLAPERAPLADAFGRVVAEDAFATADSPPFTKAMMDGFAVRAADWAGRPLQVAGERAAAPGRPDALPAGTAVRIMTGAELPDGADTVVPVERCREQGGAVAFGAPPVAGRHVLPQGAVAAKGSPVRAAGSLVTPRAAAALAEFGHAEVLVVRRPVVAFGSTGAELVEPAAEPAAGQIRNSSGPMLDGLLRAWACEPRPLGIARDDAEAIDRTIAAGLDADVLLLTGGVSAGRYDLVPDRLAAAGFDAAFHKVAIKPGKPLWFGVRQAGGRRTLAFGLPGNPVSSLVCAEVFVRPAVRLLAGLDAGPPVAGVRLASEFQQRDDRTTYWPATLDGDSATPLDWRGSADLVRVAAADGWLVVPPGDATHAAGSTLPFHDATD